MILKNCSSVKNGNKEKSCLGSFFISSSVCCFKFHKAFFKTPQSPIRQIEKKKKKTGPRVYSNICEANYTVIDYGGPHSTILALHPTALGSILGIPKKFSLEVAEIFLTALHCLVSGQWRRWIVDWTHLVLLDSTTKNYYRLFLFGLQTSRGMASSSWHWVV